MKIIHQIFISDHDQPLSDHVKKTTIKLREIYHDFEYHLYNDKDITIFLKKYFDQSVLLAYKKCNPYAFKADLVRYCLLYVFGGYYFDITICPELNLYFEHDAVLFKGITNKSLTNNYPILENAAMFFKSPKHDFLKRAIEKCVENINTHNYGRHPLDITGPMMLYNIPHSDIKTYDVEIIDEEMWSIINNKKFFKFKPKKYQSGLNHFGCVGTNSYEEMWFSKTVFKGKL